MRNDEKKLVILASVFAAIAIVFSFLRLGISISFLLVIIFWFVILIGLFNRSEMVTRIDKNRIWILIAAFVLSLIMISMLEPAVSSLQSTNSDEETSLLSADECKPIFEEYNERVLVVTGEGVSGTVGIRIDPSNCEADLNYNFIFAANLAANFTPPNMPYQEYRYAGGVNSEEDEGYVVGSSEVSTLYGVPFQISDPFNFGLPQDVMNSTQEQMNNGASSSDFYVGWSRAYNFREDSLEKLRNLDVLKIYDGGDSMIVEKIDENSNSYYMDSTDAVEKGDVAQEYKLTYSEAE